MVGPEGGSARERNLQEVYIFYPGHYPIYPESGYAGAPTEAIEAVKTGGKKIHGLTGYCSKTLLHLFHIGGDGRKHFWQRSVGTKFGAFSRKAYKKKL